MNTPRRGRPRKNPPRVGGEQAERPSPTAQATQPIPPPRVIQAMRETPMTPPVNTGNVSPTNGCSGLSFPSYMSNFPPSFDMTLSSFDGHRCEVSIENSIDRFDELAKLKNLSDLQKTI